MRVDVGIKLGERFGVWLRNAMTKGLFTLMLKANL